ncbi:SDR family NAD(P)-dependent oxidoreductase, partial [archaeon]
MSAGAPPTLGDVLPDVSEEEWGIALRVVAAVAALPPEAYASKPVRAFRVAVVPLVNRLHAAMHGEARAASDAKRESVHSGALKKQQQKALDAAFINKTKLRATRLAKLAELSTQESEGTGTLLMIPDGIADDSVVTTTGAGYAAPRALTDAPLPSAVPGASMGDMHDDDAAASVIHTAVAATTTGAEHCAPKPAVLTDTADDAADTSAPLPAAPTPVAAGVPATGEEEESTPQLFKHRGCYTCKRRFNVLHHFYSSMCPDCAALNWLKRNQTVDLRGRIALVTGARVKIGFHVALKLLRAGAHVIATSRFPHDTAERYAAQPDFGVWKDRLHVYGIDFRDIQALEAFCAFMYREYTHLDILINNACQTVRRPPAYYAHMMPKETAPLDALPPALQPLVQR